MLEYTLGRSFKYFLIKILTKFTDFLFCRPYEKKNRYCFRKELSQDKYKNRFLFSDDAEVLLSKNLDSAEKNLGQGSFCHDYIVWM